MNSTFTFTINQDTKKGVLKDTTDLEALGFTPSLLALYEVKGLGTVSVGTNIIEQKLTVEDPLIDLANGATEFEFDLELDSNGDIANVAYTLEYSVRMTANGISYAIPMTNTVLVSDVPELFNFLVEGDTLEFSAGDPSDFLAAQIDEISIDEEVLTIVLDENILVEYGQIAFDITNPTFTGSWTYQGCKMVEGCIGFQYNCEYGERGSWTVFNETNLPSGAEIVGISGTGYYPSSLDQPPVTFTMLPYQNNILAQGGNGFTVKVYQQIEQTMSDGLIVTYTLLTEITKQVICSGALCSINPCLEALLKKHVQNLELQKVSGLQATVDSILIMYDMAINYKNCGDFAKYKKTVLAIEALLDAADVGCDCGCNDTENASWVFNTSPDFISQLDDVKNLIAQRIWNGIPDATVDITKGMKVGFVLVDFNTGISHYCVSNTIGAAVWKPYPNTVYRATLFQGDADPIESNVESNFSLSDFPVTYKKQSDGYFYVECALFEVGSKIRVQQGSQKGVINAYVISKGGGEYRGEILTSDTNFDGSDNILQRSFIEIVFE